MSQLITCQGGHLCKPIGPNNIKLVESVKFLFPMKFSNSILRKPSQTETKGGRFCWPIGPKNTNLVEGVDYSLSSLVIFLSVVADKSKCFSSSYTRAAIFVDRLAQTTQTCRERWILLPVKLSDSVLWLHRRSPTCLSSSDQGGRFCWPTGTKNTNFVEGVDYLLPVKFGQIPLAVADKSKKSQFSQMPGRPSCEVV